MNTHTAADFSLLRMVIETVQMLLATPARSRTTTMFLVRARFVGAASQVVSADALDLFLGDHGRWLTVENAKYFRTREAAEMAVNDARRRIWNSGNRTVSISLLPCIVETTNSHHYIN